MRPLLIGAALSGALVAGASGCMTYRGPRGVESAIEKEIGVDLDREFGLKLGWTSTRIVAAFAEGDAGDEPLDLGELTGLGVAVFTVPEGARPAGRLSPRKLGLRKWEPVLDIREPGEQVLLLAKSKGEEIHEMLVLAYDGEEVVLARLKGRLDRLLEKMLAGAEEGGARGARRAVPIAGGSPSGSER